MNQRNILIVLPSDEVGGAEMVLKTLAKYYISQGTKVHVYFLQKQRTGKWQDLDQANLNFAGSSNTLGGILCFIRYILKEKIKFDFIYSSLIHINALLSVLVKIRILQKGKLIVRESTSIYLRFRGVRLLFYDFIYRFLYCNSIDLIVFQTKKMQTQLLENCKRINRINNSVIYNPIALTEIYQLSSDIIEFDCEIEFVIAIGRLNSIKRFDRLIMAYEATVLKNKYNLILLGDGDERGNLEDLILQLNLQNKIKILGFKDNVYPYIKRASLGVISSDFEGFPNVLLQMYALNLKVVITDCCGGLEEFPNLYIDYEKSPESLARSMDYAMEHDCVIDFTHFISRYDVSNFIEIIERNLNLT